MRKEVSFLGFGNSGNPHLLSEKEVEGPFIDDDTSHLSDKRREENSSFPDRVDEEERITLGRIPILTPGSLRSSADPLFKEKHFFV